MNKAEFIAYLELLDVPADAINKIVKAWTEAYQEGFRNGKADGEREANRMWTDTAGFDPADDPDAERLRSE